MRKFLRTTKALLVAAGLCVGASAWAGTSILYSQNYQSESASVDWTCTNNQNGLSLVTSGENKYVQYSGGNNNNSRGMYLWSNADDVAGVNSLNNYTIQCDFYVEAYPDNGANKFQFVFMGNGSSWSSSNLNYGLNTANGAYLYIQEDAVSSGACTVYVGDATTAVGKLTFETNTWYTIKQVITTNASDNTKKDIVTTITDGSGNSILTNTGGTAISSIETSSVDISTLGYFKGYYLLSGRYNEVFGMDNLKITTESDTELVGEPGIAVTYAGAERTITITAGSSSEGNDVTTYYTTDGNDPTSSSNLYSAPFNVSEDCTVKAISISSTAVASNIHSENVRVGKLMLNTPTVTKTAKEGNVYTVSISSSQTSLAFPPASSTIYYQINGGVATEYSAPFTVTASSTVTAYVSAGDTYDNSSEATAKTGVLPTYFTTAKSLDFTSPALTSSSYSETTFNVNDQDFYVLNNQNSTAIDSDFGVAATETRSGNTLSFYYYATNNALYNNYSGYRNIALQNLSAGDIIRVKCYCYDNNAVVSYPVSAGYNCSALLGLDYDQYYHYIVTADGGITLSVHRYSRIYSIEVLRPSKTIVGAMDYTTEYMNAYYTPQTLVQGNKVTYTFQNHGSSTYLFWNWALGMSGTYNETGFDWTLRPDNYVVGGTNDNPYTTTYTTDGTYWSDALAMNEMVDAAVTLTAYYHNNGVFTVKTTDTGAEHVYDHWFAFNNLQSGDITVKLGVDNSWLEMVSATTGTATVDVTIGAAGWATLYTPTAVSFAGSGLTAYTATCDGSTVTLTEVENVPANTGVVLKGSTGTYNLPEIASSSTEQGDLQGSIAGVTWYDASLDRYMLAMNGEEAQFTKLGSDFITAGKAFLVVDGNGARSLKVVFTDESTGIDSVNSEEREVESYYNLNGQRVAAPQKGLYIINGKKVIMK